MSSWARQPPWFAFLVHPRDTADLRNWPGGAVVRVYSASEEEFRAKALATPPIVAGEVVFGNAPVHGELIYVPAMPDQLRHASGRRLVVESARLAADRGARVIGLGALTAPATRGGRSLLPRLPPGVTLTTGNAFTAVVARDNVDEAIAALDLRRPARVAVVGCTGSVGAAATRLLAEAGLELILIGPDAERVRRSFANLAGPAVFSGDLADVRRADVVLLLTNAPTARLRPGLFRDPHRERAGQTTVVVDLAQPLNVPRERQASFRRRGVTVVEGGLAEIPGYATTFDLGNPAGATFACLAETYLFAREGLREHAVGPASVELARTLQRVARRHGVRTRSLSLASGYPPVPVSLEAAR
jgi:fatty aldehyde-generating acyl-ACP reductase